MKSPATLLTLVSAALALGLAGLLPAAVCLLVMVLVVAVGVLVPLKFPQVTGASWSRTAVAGAALGLVVLATALTGSRALITGDVDDQLASAAAVLAVPEGVPLGLLAALAAGSLVAVTLELGDRRGVQSGLVLGAAVLGLACVAAPSGQRLLIPIIVGWPAALFALTKLTTVQARQASAVIAMKVTAGRPESGLAPVLRWRVVPVLLAIAVSCALLGAAAASGLAEVAMSAAAGASGGSSGGSSARAWDTKFLGGRMSLNSRGPLSETPVAEVPADAPTHWRTATLDFYTGTGWQTTGSSSLTTTLESGGDGVVLRTAGEDSASSVEDLDGTTDSEGNSADGGDGSTAGGGGSTGDVDGSTDGSTDGTADSATDGTDGTADDPDGTSDDANGTAGDENGTAGDENGTATDSSDGSNSSGSESNSNSGSGSDPTPVPTTTGSLLNPDPAVPDGLTNPADPGDLGIGNSSLKSRSDSRSGAQLTPEPTSGSDSVSGIGTSGGADSLESAADSPSSTTQLGAVRSDEVVIRGRGTAQLISPGRVLTANLPARYADRIFISNGDRVMLPASNGDEYLVRSQVYPRTAQPESMGTGADDRVVSTSSTIDQRWLQIPENLPTRVLDLSAQLTANASTRLAAVQAVEQRLDQMMTYTLDAAVPPQGRDAVDFALFDSGQGYCEHFASAEIVLLRAAGIPARMVVGYLADGSDRTDDGRQVIRGAAAHAWVEVWFPGAGWVTSDPTPSGGVGQTFMQSLNSRFNRLMSDLADHTVAFVTGIVGPVILIAIGLVLWLFRRPLGGLFRRRSRKPRVAEPHRIDPALRKAFASLESALEQQGVARAENETLATLKDRVIGDRAYLDTTEKDQLEKAFDVLTRALYARTPPDENECREAAKIFDDETDRRQEALKTSP